MQHRTGNNVGRNNAAGIATRYGMDGPELKPWWGARTFHLSTPVRMKLVPSLILCCFKIHFLIIHPSTPKSVS